MSPNKISNAQYSWDIPRVSTIRDMYTDRPDLNSFKLLQHLEAKFFKHKSSIKPMIKIPLTMLETPVFFCSLFNCKGAR
jgi:hypothetical protein